LVTKPLGGYDIAPVAEIARKIRQVYAAIQPPSDPMLAFDERDLMRFAEPIRCGKGAEVGEHA
jgi:hypothetical protein